MSAHQAAHRERRRLTWFAGAATLLAARVADTVTTAPVLAVAPSAELNPLARAAVIHTGVLGYVAISLLAVPVVLLTVEVLLALDHWIRRQSWCPDVFRSDWISDNTARILGYSVVVSISLLAAISNAHQLATALAQVPGVIA